MSAPYHAAVLVGDLDEALDNFEDVLGIAFREPDERALRPFDRDADGRGPTGPVRFAFSVGSSPHVELIEAQEGGLFGAATGLGVHHVGAWREGMDRVREEQAEAGLETAARFADPDGVERVFYAGERPLMLETVNARLRPDYEAWLAAGSPRPSASPARGGTYHLAYLVADIAAAMPLYERLLGVEFRPTMKRPMITGVGPEKGDPSGEKIEVEFTYSLGERTPYVELMQMRDDDSVFGRAVGEGFHHLGIWSPDPQVARAAQLAAGAEIEARYFSKDGVERVCFASFGGVRGEFVNEAIRPQTEEWLPVGSHRG
ncbi:MAG: VOC family protein [Actinobacteria bacterium]|nr:VOC family protein [Actinomycetota bacterium]